MDEMVNGGTYYLRKSRKLREISVNFPGDFRGMVTQCAHIQQSATTEFRDLLAILRELYVKIP